MNQIKILEYSLLFALCAALLTGLWAQGRQRQLSGELVRLHVVANSDNETDQAAKLQVRDTVLAELSPKLASISDPAEAETVIRAELPRLQRSARESLQKSGKFYPARAELRYERFPTRHYAGFSLPAGNYVSLCVTLGEGQGHNWWCVVFPPLCTVAAEDEGAFASLPTEDARLIRCDEGYAVRFHLIEWYEKLRSKF